MRCKLSDSTAGRVKIGVPGFSKRGGVAELLELVPGVVVNGVMQTERLLAGRAEPVPDATRKKFTLGGSARGRIVAPTDRLPLLMIHGDKDNYIVPSIARQLFDIAREPKEFWLVSNARHNGAIQVATAEYSARVAEFFESAR